MTTKPTSDVRTALIEAIALHPEFAEALLEHVEPRESETKKRRVRRTPSGAKYLGHHQ